MDHSKLYGDGPPVKQVAISSDKMKVLRQGLGLKKEHSGNSEKQPKDSFSRKNLVAFHEEGRIAAELLLKMKGKDSPADLVCVSCEGFVERCSAALSTLTEIFLPQLELNKRHEGRALFGTLCVQPFKLSSVNTVLADKSGKAVRIVIYNVASSFSLREIETRFPTGLKVAIKEPYFKLCADGKVAVRVDNPPDVVMVDDFRGEMVDDTKLQSWTEFECPEHELDRIRAEGNRLFAEQKWHEAIEQYSTCIVRSSSVVGGDANKIKKRLLLAFSNRAEAWLQLHNFKDALDDANKALDIEPTHLKSKSRRDRAWQGFGKVPAVPLSVKVEVATDKPAIASRPVLVGKASKVKHTDASPSPSTAKFREHKHPGDASKLQSAGSESKNTPFPGDALNIQSTDRKCSSFSEDGVKVTRSEQSTDCETFSLPLNASSPSKSTESNGALTDARKNFSAVPSSRADKSVIARSSSQKKKVANTKATSLSAHGIDVQPVASGGSGDSSDSSDVKLADSEDKIDASTLPKEGKPTDSQTEFSPPPPRANATKLRDTSPVSDVLQEKATESKYERPAIDCEGPQFAPWLDSVRSAGDTYLAQGKWQFAVRMYDRVVEFSPPKRNRDKVIQTLLLAYSHRSEAWIGLGDYDNALRDANHALEFDISKHPTSGIGFDAKQLLNEVRRGRAFHGLGEYERACSVFASALVKSPNNTSITDLLEKSIICCKQSREGTYDLDEYFGNGCRGPPPPCSDFVGPLEIRWVLGKGRGLFLTKDVEAGELLLVSNPLAVVRRRYRRQGGAVEDYSQLAAKWRRNDTEAGLDDFICRLSLLQSKKKMHQLYTLAIGDPDEETEIPNLNVFVPGSQIVQLADWENLTTDLERIRGIVLLNAIDGGLNPLDGAHNQDLEVGEEIGCVGLWVLPSFMNHSCVPNCHMIDVGNAMFVRASRNLVAGDELTRAYFNVYKNLLDRQDSCQEWLFSCTCERCVLEKTLASQRILPVQEYRNILDKFREESLKRLHSTGKDRSLSLLLPNPQPALLQLRKFADWFDGLLLQAEGLGNKEKAWIGASHLQAYISRLHTGRDRNRLILALEIILEFMTNTALLGIGHAENALQKAALLLEHVEDKYGTGSKTYRRIEIRVLDLYATAYGKLRKEVLLSMSTYMTMVP